MHTSIFQRNSNQLPASGNSKILVTDAFSNLITKTLNDVIGKAERLPPHCILPRNASEAIAVHEWVLNMLRDKCSVMMGMHASKCYKHDGIDPLTPFITEVVQHIVEDYAWQRGWCRVVKGYTDIPTYSNCQQQASQLLTYYQNRKPTDGIKLMFLITAYTDSKHVMRLITRLYSPQHRYVVVVDKMQTEFAAEMRQLVKSIGDNVVVVTPITVVYLASSATRILAQGMAWMLK